MGIRFPTGFRCALDCLDQQDEMLTTQFHIPPTQLLTGILPFRLVQISVADFERHAQAAGKMLESWNCLMNIAV